MRRRGYYQDAQDDMDYGPITGLGMLCVIFSAVVAGLGIVALWRMVRVLARLTVV